MMIEPGGVGVLRYVAPLAEAYRGYGEYGVWCVADGVYSSYQHHNIDEPAFLLGMGIP